ncbi:MAG: hypothetical protein ACYC2Y_00540 [Armatimonadota bacterium]
MPRYMIQLSYEPDDYIRALKEKEPRAQDLLPEVYWGRMLSKEMGWAIVKAESESAALEMVPPSLRSKVEVCEVHTLTPELIETEAERK